MAAHPPNESWFVFWTTLFPDSSGFEETMERWLKVNLVHYDQVLFHTDLELHPLPSWAEELSVVVTRQAAKFKFRDFDLGAWPWFGGLMYQAARPAHIERYPLDHDDKGYPIEPNKQCHPLRVLSASRRSAGNADRTSVVDHARDIARTVSLHAGSKITAALKKALQDGELKASAYSPDSGTRRDLPIDHMKLVTTVDLLNNQFNFPTGMQTLHGLEISLGPAIRSGRGKSNSFLEQDEPILKEMHKLVIGGVSIVKAAQRMTPNASRRKDASDDSVTQRLQKAYGRKVREGAFGTTSTATVTPRDRRSV